MLCNDREERAATATPGYRENDCRVTAVKERLGKGSDISDKGALMVFDESIRKGHLTVITIKTQESDGIGIPSSLSFKHLSPAKRNPAPSL